MHHHFNWKYLFFTDVETTGFDPIRNDLLTMCVLVTDMDFKPVGSFYDTCRPDMNHFTEGAAKIHGITPRQAANFQPRKKMLIKLLHFLNEFRTPDQYEQLIFHANGNYDWRFIDWCFRKEELHWSLYKMFSSEYLISTLSMARKAGHVGNKLNQWAERLGIKLEHHNAESDTHACMEIYKFLKGEMHGEITTSNNDNNDAKELFDHVGERINS